MHAGAAFPSVSRGSAAARAVRVLAATMLVPSVLGCQADGGAASAPASPPAASPTTVAGAAALLPLPGPGADPLIRPHGQGVSTTADGRILVELRSEDITPANPFDLNRRTVVFTPDGAGGYARRVTALDWEEDTGDPVEDGSPVALEEFVFAFAGRKWDTFHVHQQGIVTFGEPHSDLGDIRFERASEHESVFDGGPTISPLYKALNSGRQRVAQWADRVVITWSTIETGDGGYDVAPSVGPRRRAQFQAVLGADGSIRFSYRYVPFADGVVGLFPEVQRAGVLVKITDDVDPELPGHLDLLEVVLFATNRGLVIVEFETRDPIPEPGADSVYSYRLRFDFDEPYWAEDDDQDLRWYVDVWPGGDRSFGHGEWLPNETDRRIAVLAPIRDEWAGLTASVSTGTAGWEDGSFVGADRLDPVTMDFPDPRVDLSQSRDSSDVVHREIFHYPVVPTREIACRVIDVLGDRFDVFWFNTEFRIDVQSPVTPVSVYGDTEGTGRNLRMPPCGGGLLKAVMVFPIRVFQLDERERFGQALFLFAHEFIHAWTAYARFIGKNGEPERLFGTWCYCHWREELHMPAAFPKGGRFARSVMGGGFWLENGDGTFESGRFPGPGLQGPSWLDLYLMGLAAPEEVPDMLLLRNLTPVDEERPNGPHTADKEVVTMRQILAAEGPRKPGVEESQKDFNAGFVYLLEPGQHPDPDLLALQGRFRDKVVEHWSHITGERSQLTTIAESPAAPLRRH